MATAGLTRGGFYAHFDSKQDLVAEALEHAERQTLTSLSSSFDSAPAERRLQAAIDAYLSLGHAEHPEQGCPVVALGAELSRTHAKARRGLKRSIRGRLEWMRRLAGAGRSQPRKEELLGAMACMIGGMTLARAVGGKDSAEILRSCRRFLCRALTIPASKPRRAQPTSTMREKRRSRGPRAI
jgi:TetR/AcrR family transcriptional repressor of nem operon